MPYFSHILKETVKTGYSWVKKGTKVYFWAKHRTTYFPNSKRNGAKECARRIKQGLAGTCYVKL